jgi:two-component system NarL family response regulator
MVRESLRSMLAGFKQVQVVGEASDFETARDLVRKLLPDVVVMDVEMPDVSGIEATRLLLQEVPSIKVLALSGHAEGHYVDAMLRAGASGYVSKLAAHAELVCAIRAADFGISYLGAQVAGRVGDLAHSPAGANTLTTHEREIITLIADGLSTARIAKKMKLPSEAVDQSRRDLARRLNLRSTAAITKYAIREGLSFI